MTGTAPDVRATHIVGAARTAIGRFGGALSGMSTPELGAAAIAAALSRAGIEADAGIDDVIMGNVLTAGLGQNPARQAARAAGLPDTVTAFGVSMVCGSGLQAVVLADRAIRCGEASLVVAGGMESMSRAPHVADVRDGVRMGDVSLRDSMLGDGVWCALVDAHMGTTAENVAVRCGIDRVTQDAFALTSQTRAAAAIAERRFAPEIVPVEAPAGRRGLVTISDDEHPRATSPEALAALPPAFHPDGTVTAGNSSGINDGAAALVVASDEEARTRSLPVLATIRASAAAGLAPDVMGLGPIGAIRDATARAGITIAEVDLFELNEAFASQAVAVCRELALDPERVNVNGGAIALGHPIGASGARILVTLLHELARRDGRYGVAALCIGGGMGIAMVVERPASAG